MKMTYIKIGFSFAWRSLRAAYLPMVGLWALGWGLAAYLHFKWDIPGQTLSKYTYLFVLILMLPLATVARDAATETLGVYDIRYNGFPVWYVPILMFWCGAYSDWLFRHQLKYFWDHHFLMKPVAGTAETFVQLGVAGWYLARLCGEAIPRLPPDGY
jgi:hypothetical protein